MAAKIRLIVLGGGGHARMVIDSLRAGGWDVAELAVVDNDAAGWGDSIYGVPVIGGDDKLEELAAQGAESFVVGKGSIGDNRPRERLFNLALAAGLKPFSVVHPSAIVSPQAALEPGCQLFPGCVVNAGAVIGANAVVNTRAVVEHDCLLDEHCHVASGAVLGGGVRVGRRAQVGLGASVLQYLSIGDDALVGVGAVVVKNVPPGITVTGVPARPTPKTG